MTQYQIKKSQLSGQITIPSSKSHTLRAILFGSLARGKSVIHHPLCSPDTDAMINACRLFGAKIEVSSQQIEIMGLNGQLRFAEDVIHAGNSGIVLRFCTAVGALSNLPVVITGDHSIRYQRPIKPLLEALSQVGVSAISMRGDGYAPVIINGRIQPGKTTIDGEDSQPVSALLIAAAFAQGPIEIEVRNPGERPWVALTLDWFDRLGISYENRNFHYYRVQGFSEYEGFEYFVPGDLSSAAFPIAAALVTKSEITLKNVNMNDSQGDKEFIYILKRMGAHIEIDSNKGTLHVLKEGSLNGITVDVNNCIDAITILAVIACYAEGETHIYNGAIAKHKECNRIHCIATELRKMGADITETEEGLIIRKSTLKGAELYSHHDHRMVMSLAVAALGAVGESIISPAESIQKTYRSFMDDFNKIGAQISRDKS